MYLYELVSCSTCLWVCFSEVTLHALRRPCIGVLRHRYTPPTLIACCAYDWSICWFAVFKLHVHPSTAEMEAEHFFVMALLTECTGIGLVMPKASTEKMVLTSMCRRIVCCGHSLGGALANLCSIWCSQAMFPEVGAQSGSLWNGCLTFLLSTEDGRLPICQHFLQLKK